MESLFDGSDLKVARDFSTVAFASPFSTEAETAYRRLLGPAWTEVPGTTVANRASILERAEQLVAAARRRLQAGLRPSDDHRALYEDAVLLLLFVKSERRLAPLLDTELGPGSHPPALPWYSKFAAEAEELLAPAGGSLLALHPPQHQIASFYQIARALRAIEGLIVGSSSSTARLRSAIWQSVFTIDLRRYRRTAYRTLDDVPTLITGPSGSGKELVARAIGYSRYVPFDVGARRFTVDPRTAFHALNLSALSPTLIESELFGHRRGAFTGAQEDRIGWLESCPAGGAVFLDEIGEISPDIQVKLLRVIESRTFQRLGETKPRQFVGKIVAATNRDLGHEMRAGHFREDLYYRLCADMLTTPPLTESIRDAPGERRALIHHVATRLVGESEADELTRQVESVVHNRLGDEYGWPGNFRELEQCVRNVLIHGDYKPAVGRSVETDPDDLGRGMRAASFTADELVRRYIRIVYDRCGNLVETARRLDLDRRTVRAKLGMGEGQRNQISD